MDRRVLPIISTEQRLLFAHLETMIVECLAPHPEGSFHPKLWVLKRGVSVMEFKLEADDEKAEQKTLATEYFNLAIRFSREIVFD